mgnify:FL=1
MLLLISYIGCAAVVEVDVDIDGDGLLGVEEGELGTDPELADSDGDGIDDGEELAESTDQTDENSYPCLGGWKIDSCAGDIEGEGWSKGDVSNAVVGFDSYGQDVSLYSFCDKVVYMVFAAFW